VLGVTLVVAALGAASAFVYLGRERLGAEGVGLAALRTVGLGALVLLLFNPTRAVRETGGPPTVLLDASLSMAAAGGRWAAALDTALALAGDDGLLLRFGVEVSPFDTLGPADGLSLAGRALSEARARGGPVIVVSDGELSDARMLPPTLLAGASWVLLPRDTVASAALLDVHVPERVLARDSIPITVTIGTWGALSAGAATLEIFEGERRLRVLEIELPPPPGTARRQFTLAPGVLRQGEHALRLRLSAEGDDEPRDNVRERIVLVTDEPGVVVIVDPPDWEGRFLVRALRQVSGASVQGYTRPETGRWVEMQTLVPVEEQTVRTAARRAGLLVVRGQADTELTRNRRGPVWNWPAASDTLTHFYAGDWYVERATATSPLAGRLAGVAWDSLPPLTGVVPLAPASGEWVGLTARQGRRGVARPALVGTEQDGRRELTTVGGGLWRWAFRGGAANEAYRGLLAAGVDWLLRSESAPRGASLTASGVVPRGVPVSFQWRGQPTPDSVVISFAGDSAGAAVLRFDPEGSALVSLGPGVYRWATTAAGGASGVSVVESYSSEFVPGGVMTLPTATADAFRLLAVSARQRWWLFVVALLAFAAEWAWRQRRGLP
jgi:hypothetical protein